MTTDEAKAEVWKLWPYVWYAEVMGDEPDWPEYKKAQEATYGFQRTLLAVQWRELAVQWRELLDTLPLHGVIRVTGSAIYTVKRWLGMVE
jgi:hypothetical protein